MLFRSKLAMPDERMKLLTLDRWGAANLDKCWTKLSSGEKTEEKIEQEKWRWGSVGTMIYVGKYLDPVGVLNRF